jgi:hypothetical protein
VRYGEHQAIVEIHALAVIEGRLPRRAAQLALDWAELHQAELLENWGLCREKKLPKQIAPLQ